MTARLFALACLLVTACAAGADPADEASAAERRLLALVNQARAEARLPPLARHDRLDEAARATTKRMAKARAPRHSDVRELLRQLRVEAVAENVAMGPDAEAIHRRLMASRPHRANTLGPYDALGVAVTRAGDGQLYATLVFAAPAPPTR